MVEVFNAKQTRPWRDLLGLFPKYDVCHLPEYHEAYSLRIKDSEAVMWSYKQDGNVFCYPFLLSPVILTGPDGKDHVTDYFDISGIYGYSGPLSTTDDQGFLNLAWSAFDKWSQEQNLIAEFIRFSVYVDNKKWAHSNCQVEANRPVSRALLPQTSDEFMSQLKSKTRNMIRKAGKADLVAKPVGLDEGLKEFRELYDETMGRNQATGFFMYDDEYYNKLLGFPEGEVVLYGVYESSKMVAAAMGLIAGPMALYHLGASTRDASRLGAGNLALFEMSSDLIKRGISYFNIGGGRTTEPDDPLFSFKKSNGTSVDEFYIGKRVIDSEAYDSVAKRWQLLYNSELESPKLQFYR